MAEIVLDKIDPLRKTLKAPKRIEELKAKNTSHENTNLDVKTKDEEEGNLRRSVSTARIVKNKKNKVEEPIKAAVKRELSIRDQGGCSYISPLIGQKCESTFFLEIDHIIPRATGGGSQPDNLRLLCKAHNQFSAIGLWAKENELLYKSKTHVV